MRTLLRTIVVATLTVTGASLAQDSPSLRQLLDGAQRAAQGQRYDEAMTLYEQARVRLPEAAQIPYNMGVASFRQGNLQRAAELFDQARMLADDPALRARSAYNLGTTAYRRFLEQPQDPAQADNDLGQATEELKRALEQFREALDADPDNGDARANGELAYQWLKQLEQMQQQQQQGEPQQQNQQQDQEQDQQQQDQQPSDDPNATNQPRDDASRQSGESGEQQPQEQQTPQPQDTDKQQDGQQEQAEPAEGRQAEDQPPEAQDPGQRAMTREEAERLLQSVRDKERRRAEELARRQAARQPQVDKDW